MRGRSLPELTFQDADGQNALVELSARQRSETVATKQIRAYPLESEADPARIALEGGYAGSRCGCRDRGEVRRITRAA